MTTWKQLFGDEYCKCGKRGEYIVSVRGTITGYLCAEHQKEKEEKEQK